MPRGEEIVGRFGEDLLEAGFCPVPNLLLAYQDLLYLAPAEVNAIVQIWMEWWSGAEPPTVAAIAGRMGMTRRGLQKVLRTLRECDLLSRAGASAPAWVIKVNGIVQQEVTAYCAQTYEQAAGPPFGYLLILPGRTSWGQKEENQYDFYPLLAYLRKQELDPAAWTRGQTLYARNCAVCHGPGGRGNGPAAQAQPKRPANFTDPQQMAGASEAILRAKIVRGGMGSGMPYWGRLFDEQELQSLLSYLESFFFAAAPAD